MFDRYDFTVTDEEIKELSDTIGDIMTIPENFEVVAPTFNKTQKLKDKMYINPQTTLLCTICDLTNPYAEFMGQSSVDTSVNSSITDTSQSMSDTFVDSDTSFLQTSVNPDEIDVNDSESDSCDSEDAKSEDVKELSKEILNLPSQRKSLSLPSPALQSSVISPPKICDDTTSNSHVFAVPKDSPKPLFSEVEIPPLESSQLSSSKCSKVSDNDSFVATTTTEDSTTDEDIKQKPKKFKRRNVALYTDTEESC